MFPKPNTIDNKWEILQITVTDNCNLLCKHCMKTEKFYRGYNSLETFKRYLSNFSPENFDVLVLSDFGEPFLRKDILDVLRHAKQEGFKKVRVISNLVLLNEPTAEAIIQENLLEQILVSTEAASKELFEWVRGASFDTWISKIGLLNSYKKKFNSNFPRLIFNVTCFKENLDELPQIMDLAQQYEIDSVLFVHLNAIAMDKTNAEFAEKICTSEHRLDRLDQNHVHKIFEQIKEKAIAYGIPIDLPESYPSSAQSDTTNTDSHREEEQPTCDFPDKWVQVSEEGEVYPCCQISKKFSMGNLNESSHSEIWNSDQFVKFREDLKNGIPPTYWCEICNVFKGKRF